MEGFEKLNNNEANLSDFLSDRPRTKALFEQLTNSGQINCSEENILSTIKTKEQIAELYAILSEIIESEDQKGAIDRVARKNACKKIDALIDSIE